MGIQSHSIPLLKHPIISPKNIKCTENVVRWWLLEHQERRKHDTKVSFPGESGMPCGLILWLSGWERGSMQEIRNLEGAVDSGTWR
jgi:hypothetical protein